MDRNRDCAVCHDLVWFDGLGALQRPRIDFFRDAFAAGLARSMSHRPVKVHRGTIHRQPGISPQSEPFTLSVQDRKAG